MASVWGGSWGANWGDSWGLIFVTTPAGEQIVLALLIQRSGGVLLEIQRKIQWGALMNETVTRNLEIGSDQSLQAALADNEDLLALGIQLSKEVLEGFEADLALTRVINTEEAISLALKEGA